MTTDRFFAIREIYFDELLPDSLRIKALKELLKISTLKVTEDEQLEIEAYWDWIATHREDTEKANQIIREYKLKKGKLTK